MSQVIYPATNLASTESFIADRGEGVYVYDDKGNRYLEGLAGLWCNALGYGNEELIETTAKTMRDMSYSHMFGGRSHQVGIDLADKLAELVPVPNAKIFFGNSGSDANDTIIKTIRYWSNVIGKPEKRKIIARELAYHGVTIAAGALTSTPANVTHFDPPRDALGIVHTDAPYFYRGANVGESEEEFVNRIVGNLEQLILEEDPDTIAAMICEPVTGASGVIVPPRGYHEQVQKVLDKYDIIFWADEVITGFGRTGTIFGCESQGIEKPGLMTVAKQISSAYFPISASVFNGEMYDALVEPSSKVGVFGHGYTYSGHPVGCAVALKTLEIYERENIYGHAAEVGMYMQRRLREFDDHEIVGDVRGAGLIGAVEIVADKVTKQPFEPAAAGYLQQACQDAGLIGRALAGTTFAVCPPLIITKEQIDEMIESLRKGLDATAAQYYAQSRAS